MCALMERWKRWWHQSVHIVRERNTWKQHMHMHWNRERHRCMCTHTASEKHSWCKQHENGNGFLVRLSAWQRIFHLFSPLSDSMETDNHRSLWNTSNKTKTLLVILTIHDCLFHCSENCPFAKVDCWKWQFSKLAIIQPPRFSTHQKKPVLRGLFMRYTLLSSSLLSNVDISQSDFTFCSPGQPFCSPKAASRHWHPSLSQTSRGERLCRENVHSRVQE